MGKTTVCGANSMNKYYVPAGRKITRITEALGGGFIYDHIVTTKDAFFTDKDLVDGGPNDVTFTVKLPVEAEPFTLFIILKWEVELL